ncbi:MAG: peptide-methionine (S)-S-oxide reductase [Fretibacterium sp.]|nr:peptide-methionine (S)-S-oxide reductase [Fretibacterium sp.]
MRTLERPRIDTMVPEPLETALFALGSFQDMEARLGFVRGVWRTCTGYAGGMFPSPSYENTGDHIEAVSVEYDPQGVSYGQLLELFMGWHRTAALDTAPRHRAVIFVQTEKERRLARAAVERSALCGSEGHPPVRVLPLKTFIPAENSWQKYYLHHAASWLYEKLLSLYGGEDALLCSTLAARLNGFLRQPSPSALRCLSEIVDLCGLSACDRQALMAMAI